MPRPRKTSLAAALLVLCTGFTPAPAAADLAGWEGTRWGMTAAELEAAIGPALSRLKTRLDYHDAYVGHALSGRKVAGHAFTALFQMDRATGRLQQVILERRRDYALAIAFDQVARALKARFGPPTLGCDSRDRASGAAPFLRQRMWAMPTTTVHLSLIDFTQGVLMDDARRDIDPLRPSYERRLYHRNLMARRLLIRYHASARRDLARLRCDVTVREPG